MGDHRINSDIDLFMLTDDSAVVRDMTEDIPFDRKLRPVIVEPLELTMMERNDKEFLTEIRKGVVMWEAGAWRRSMIIWSPTGYTMAFGNYALFLV